MKKVIRLVSCMLLTAGICGNAFAGNNETVENKVPFADV